LLELIHIGHSLKSRGIQGNFKAHINKPFEEVISSARAVFINLNGSKVPFLIEKCIDGKNILLKLEEVDSPEDISHLLGKELYLNKSEIPAELLMKTEEQSHPMLNYQILDQNDNAIATIEELVEYPEQLLAKINYKEKELLLPIHEDLIISLDEEAKIIKLQLIDGLLDL